MPQIIILGLAVGLMLLIACANVGGLLLARGAVRKPEIAIRAALGASRGRVVTQLLVEASMFALLAGAAGIALALWLQRLLPIATGLAGLGVAPRHLEWPVLLFAFLVSVVTALLFGLIPALWITSSNTGAAALAHGTRTTGSAGGMRSLGVLVVAQVAISMVLMLAAGLLVRSFTRLVNTNPSFDPKNLVTGELQLPNSDPPKKRLQLYDVLRQDFASVPGVTAVGFIDRLPIRQRYGNLPVWDVKHPPDNRSLRQSAHTRLVLPGYFDALRIPLLAGRDIAGSDRAGAVPVMVINERMANTLFPGQNAVGQHVKAVLTPLGGESSLPLRSSALSVTRELMRCLSLAG